MRFLFFNLVVGAALLYLYKGGDIDLSRFAGVVNNAPVVVAANAPQPKSVKPGHARDVIDEPAAPAPKPKPTSKKAEVSEPTAPAKSATPNEREALKLPTIEKEISVAKRTPKTPRFENTVVSEDPAVLRRRAEVLETTPQKSGNQEFALKEGTSLMSTADRRRSLETLAEEMEMLFLEQVGG